MSMVLSQDPRAPRSRLRWQIVGVLLLASILPLALLGIGAWIVFGNLLEEKTLDRTRALVQSHAQSIDRYLSERLRVLEIVAATHSREDLGRLETLERVFRRLVRTYDRAFVDLGVIAADGRHLAYVGPYALADRNYRREAWFRSVMAEGSYVSDVFLGFRQVPHCIIAIRRQQGQQTWILRATLNSEQFASVVRLTRLGRTADAFIVNVEGRYQTPPRVGRVLDSSPISSPPRHRGIRVSRVSGQHGELAQVTTWLNRGRWMLVVRQDAAEIQQPLRQAMGLGGLVIGLAVALMAIAVVLATWHLTRQLELARARQERLSQDLLRSAKLASLGEMSAGLAHEINNPLAVISAEQTNIADLVSTMPDKDGSVAEVMESVRCCKRQVERCRGITGKMLQFGRQTDARVEPVLLGPRLNEIMALMSKQAEVRNIRLLLDVEPELPPVLANGIELEQVLVNLIVNAFHAIDRSGEIKILARATSSGVELSVVDTGCGIAPEDLERVLQPFFTTKPVGQGTGLGLSVCYGVVQNWGGTLQVESEQGQGTRVRIQLRTAQEKTSLLEALEAKKWQTPQS